MEKNKLLYSFIFLICTVCQLQGKTIKESYDLENKQWPAQWITHTEGLYSLKSTGLFLFRKNINLNNIPTKYIIHVSADNRYKLYINGRYIGSGPATSDIKHWYYDTYNISKYLKAGNNILAAEVWNWGDNAPWCQLSYRTAFLVQGNSDTESAANTDNSWFVYKTNALTFFKTPKDEFAEETGAGPNERFNANLYPYCWIVAPKTPGTFIPATTLNNAIPASLNKETYEWNLIPRPIPFMEESKQCFNHLLSVSIKHFKADFLKNQNETIPANTQVCYILDQGVETCAYPVICVSKGRNASLKVTYSESLFDSNKRELPRTARTGNINGVYDIFIPNGDDSITFTSHWYRTFRYIEIKVNTANEPIIIHQVQSIFNAYPFLLKSSFESSDSLVNEIFKTGWRTARLCAHETYIDCPYYERLQYLGDFPYSNPITTLLSGDVRLMKNAINQANWSRQDDGLTFCAYPENSKGKIIPQFSLAWIDMIYQYLMISGDLSIVKEHKHGISQIIDWYKAHLNKDKLLGPMPFWNFVDCNSLWPWAPETGNICEPEGTKDGNSALLTLQFAYGLMRAGQIMKISGNSDLVQQYDSLLTLINTAVFEHCYTTEKRYIAETPNKNTFSQHTNILAACTGCLQGDMAKDILVRLDTDNSLIKCSLQFKAYYHLALQKNHLLNNYIGLLDEWKKLIRDGFSTFPEYPDINTRSDCHAWSAYPTYELLTMVCGFQAQNAGMTNYIIEPQLGTLSWAKGSIYNPKGNLSIDIKKGKYQKLHGTVSIPNGVNADLIINNRIVHLKEGTTVF